jgi:D-alanyl-D-alanine carboxypeptidase/D-alanyl-D-alanine-endopeptidase (penicillin-binding protein 4)
VVSTSSPAVTATTRACAPDPALRQPEVEAPADLVVALAAFLADARVATHSVGLSVWVDGYGEVLTHDPDRPLVPASNQKLITAIGALALLGPGARLTTDVHLTAAGDLVVVGGGDPTLRSTGAHSLAALAAQARDSGVTTARRVLVDESRHDGARRANGWQDWQIPTYVGPMSAFMVDDNRWRRDAAFLADPALANGGRLADALRAEGIQVVEGAAYGSAGSESTVVATLESPPTSELVASMLQRSDNQTADLLLKEVGRAGAGLPSLVAGGAAARAVMSELCLTLTGTDDDGSGLSRANTRSAREWRELLQAARPTAWWPMLYQALPVAGRSGTLASRFGGTAAAGNVHAKTGTIIGGAALSGYGTTGSGRAFVFSVIVNGPRAESAAPAIDMLIAAIAGHRG